MAGAVVENLSNRKLLAMLGALVVLQVLFFLLGGIFAPAPTSSMEVITTKCHDSKKTTGAWFYIRPNNCVKMDDYKSIDIDYEDQTGDFVLVAQIPGPRDGMELEYSPWFQWLLALLIPEVINDDGESSVVQENSPMLLDVRIGYRTADSDPHDWKELLHTSASRRLECDLTSNSTFSDIYPCEPLELFELGSNDYPFYLINIRIPVNNNTPYNQKIGRWQDIKVVAIHQNGGFTMIWLSLKTFLSPITLGALVWFWRRILALNRGAILLERTLFMLGCAMMFLNLPIEWLSLLIRMPFLLLFSDLRQGVFYACLAVFWLIFVGEHLLVGTKGGSSLSSYKKHLAVIVTACSCLFIFDMCERGIHITNPTYSIWSTKLGTDLAHVFVALGILSALAYFVYLFVGIVRVWLAIRKHRATIATMNRSRQISFEGVIYRFKFLMLFTLTCAALTVAGFIMSNVGEMQLHSGDFEDAPMLQYTSAFQTGVYGMWNIYVCLLLALYAPSHKRVATRGVSDAMSLDELLEERPASSNVSQFESSAMSTLIKPAQQ